jgi:hypothetical protein
VVDLVAIFVRFWQKLANDEERNDKTDPMFFTPYFVATHVVYPYPQINPNTNVNKSTPKPWPGGMRVSDPHVVAGHRACLGPV